MTTDQTFSNNSADLPPEKKIAPPQEPFSWSNGSARAGKSPAEASDREGWLVATGVFVSSLMLYVATMCRTVFWWDSGELVANASILGIAHRPGFPFYILLARVFGLPPVGSYFYRINFLSAFCAATAAGLVAYVLVKLLTRHGASTKATRISAVLGALSMVVTFTFWIQAVRAEVYALNALIVAVVILLLSRADQNVEHNKPVAYRCFYAAMFIFGVGLGGHHATLASTLPAVLLLVVFIFGRQIFRPGRLFMGAFFMLAGLSIYLYLPLRAAQEPLLSWGWDNTSLTAGAGAVAATDAYQNIIARTPQALAANCLAAAKLIWINVGPFTIGLALIGWIFWLKRATRWMVFFLVMTLGNILVTALLAKEFIEWNNDLHGYLLPSLLMVAFGVGGGVFVFLVHLPRLLNRLIRQRHVNLAAQTAVVFFAIVLPIAPGLFGFPYCNLSRNRLAEDLGRETLLNLPPDAVVVMEGVNWNFVLRGLQFADQVRPDVAIINRSFISAPWYQSQCRRRYPQLLAGVDFPTGQKTIDVINWADQLRANGHQVFWEFTEREFPRYSRFHPAGHLYRLVTADSTLPDSLVIAQENFERASYFYNSPEELKFDFDAQGMYMSNLYRAGLYYESWGLYYRARELYRRALAVRPAEATIWISLLRVEGKTLLTTQGEEPEH